MIRSSLLILLCALPVAALAQQAVFIDNLTHSTVNANSVPGGTPTASFTSYDIAASKAATTGSLITNNALRLSLNAATGSGFLEAQALFSATPVTLVTAGDFINLTYTFTNTAGTLLAGGTSSYILNGFYNSGGSAPVPGGLASAGLGTGGGFTSGNCANWQGYVSRISSGSTSLAYTRPQEIGYTCNEVQDLVGDGFGTGAYSKDCGAAGLTFDASETATLALTTEGVYTISYTVTLWAPGTPGTLVVSNCLYSGSDNTGPLLFVQTNTLSASTNLTQSFDGFAIGVRNATATFNPEMDISKIAIIANIFGTPGPSFDVTGGGSGCPGTAFLVGLNGSAALTNVYYLYTNGMADGAVAPVVGTGSAINFGPQSVPATYQVLASNTVSGFTGLMIGSATVTAFSAPTITTQPSALLAANNSAGAFSVAAPGGSLGFQWYRNGVGLANAGEFSGVTTSNLLINPVTGADVAAQPQGYYVIITNTCGQQIISSTNSLSLRSPANLVWAGGNPNDNWDVTTTANFVGPTVFHEGDNVTFDDTSANPMVNIVGSSVAPGVMTESAGQNYAFTAGSAPLIGNGSLVMSGSGTLTISNANAYTGGSTLNAGVVSIRTFNNPLGTGPINMNGGTLDVPQAGTATAGISNDVNTVANSTFDYDTTGTFAMVFLGQLTGSPGKALTLFNLNATTTLSRIRLYGPFTNNADMVFSSGGTSIDLAPYLPSDNQVYNGVISGTFGRIVARSTGHAVFANSSSTFNDTSVSGGSGYSLLMSSGNIGFGADSVTLPPTSSPVGTGNIGINVGVEGGNCGFLAYHAPHTIGNKVIYTSATNSFTVNFIGTNALTFSGPFFLHGADSTGLTNRTLDVTNGMTAILSGSVDDGLNDPNIGTSLDCGVIKSGGGTLVLAASATYTGPTLVSQGNLWVNGSLTLSPTITVTNGTLGGTGTVSQPVTITTPGAIAPGTSAIGTLTINNTVSLGNGLFKLDKSLSPAQSNDVAVVSGSLTGGTGTINVTNLGPALVVGDKFTLFSKAVAGGSSMTIAGGGATWMNSLGTDGSIKVLSVTAPTAGYPTNLTFSFNGTTTLTVGWPQTHLGWILQIETNSLAAGYFTNNFTDVAGTSSGTNAIITIDPANPAVFVRLRHP